MSQLDRIESKLDDLLTLVRDQNQRSAMSQAAADMREAVSNMRKGRSNTDATAEEAPRPSRSSARVSSQTEDA